MNPQERKSLPGLVAKFCDGTELTRDEIAIMQNHRVICTEGKGHQYALTEFGRGFLSPTSLYYKNRDRNRILINGRPAVDAKAAIYRYIHGLQLTPDQRQELLAQEYIEPNNEGGTAITPKGEALFASVPSGSFITVNEVELDKLVRGALLTVPDYQAAQEELNQRARSALDKQVAGDHYKDHAIQPIEYIQKNGLGFIEGNVVKYITRHAAKGGAADVRKVIHYCELLLELHYGEKA